MDSATSQTTKPTTNFSLSLDLIMIVAEQLPPHDLRNFIVANRCLSELLTPILNRCAVQPRYRKSALQYAAATKNRVLIRLLITAPICLLARRDDVHQTILFVAPVEHHVDQVIDNIVLEANRLVVLDTYTFSTPLHDAARAGERGFLTRLLSLGVGVNIHDFRGWTALHHAVWENDIAAATMLLHHAALVNALDTRDMSPLHFAAYVGDIDMATLLISSGANSSLKDTNGHTPIELTNKRDRAFDSLLLRSSNSSFRSSTNQTALHMAACLGDLPITIALIAANVSVTACDNFGGTALHEGSAAGHPEIVETLLLHGAAVNAQDCNGTTALHWAATEEVAAVLLAHNADMTICDNNDATPLDYIPFDALMYGADPAMRIHAGCTPLHIAVAQASIGCTKALLAKGADINAADDYGYTALHIAAEAEDYEMMEILIEAGADEQAKCNDGRTAQDIIDELEEA